MTRGIRGMVAELRDAVPGGGEIQRWPTCLLCTEASRARTPDAEHIWIPVEGYRVEPEVWRQVTIVTREGRQMQDVEPAVFNKARRLGDRGWFTVIATCHGDEQRASIDVPYWWGKAHVFDAIRNLMFFGKEEYRTHGLVDRV